MNKTHLGDCVYVEFDGIDFTLTTEIEDGISNTIFLPPDIVDALNFYIEKMRSEEWAGK